MIGPICERIASDEWTAEAVADRNPDLFWDLAELFTQIDPREMTCSALDAPQADAIRIIEALDDWFGEIVDPYADEDDA